MSALAGPPSGPPSDLPTEVVRSAKRRKTIQARLVDGRLRVLIPSHLSAEEEAHWVAEMQRRFGRRARTAEVDLPRRARALARRFHLPTPAGIRWVDNQQSRWGSCTPATGQIRISNRLAGCPSWVLDYVIVHELAHLVVAGHGPEFHALAERYPKAERAIGYLLAKGLDPDAQDLDEEASGGTTSDDGRSPSAPAPRARRTSRAAPAADAPTLFDPQPT